MLKRLQASFVACLFIFSLPAFANSHNEIDLTAPDPNSDAAIDKRAQKEDVAEKNPFAITFYKQNYILPYYYTGSPYQKVYLQQQWPKIKNSEIKFQLSLKVPVWRKIFGSNSSLYFGYTQLSYWQAYNRYAFFRENDFQPELFLINQMNIPLFSHFRVNEINVGVIHESNGFGIPLERSWNRVYIEAIASTEHFMLTVKPWYVFHDSSYQKFNPDMANYLGYGEITIGYKFCNQVLSLQTHSLIEGGGRHATFIASYSFPLTTHLNGFIQAFSGYGQSLIEYNHRTNSIGVGIEISNLI